MLGNCFEMNYNLYKAELKNTISFNRRTQIKKAEISCRAQKPSFLLAARRSFDKVQWEPDPGRPLGRKAVFLSDLYGHKITSEHLLVDLCMSRAGQDFSSPDPQDLFFSERNDLSPSEF